jgi:hypothetical protein
MVEWIKFNPTSFEEGLYFVLVYLPEVDGDVDYQGKPIGWYTGNDYGVSSIAYIGKDNNGDVYVEPLVGEELPRGFGNLYREDVNIPTYVAKIELPAFEP